MTVWLIIAGSPLFPTSCMNNVAPGPVAPPRSAKYDESDFSFKEEGDISLSIPDVSLY